MSKLLGLLVIVAVLVVTLLGSVAPAKASDTDAQYCAWYNRQYPVVSTFGGWSIYDVDPVCSRLPRLTWISAADVRPTYGPGTLAQWAAGGK